MQDCSHDPDNCFSEKLIKHTADLLVSEGYAAVGYEYLNMGDCWQAPSRTPTGHVVADSLRFPPPPAWHCPSTIVCGAANTQLKDPAVDGAMLHERGITYTRIPAVNSYKLPKSSSTAAAATAAATAASAAASPAPAKGPCLRVG